MTAILYTSNTGSTERYAKMLGEKIGLPVYALDGAPVARGEEILYMGWVMASGIKGYKKACQKYKVKAVCGVCMGATGSQIPELRKQNAIPESLPLYTLQGGFDINRLHGMYKFMMNLIGKSLRKGLSEKNDRSPDEDDMLDMLLHGGDRVNENHLEEILNWYHERK